MLRPAQIVCCALLICLTNCGDDEGPTSDGGTAGTDTDSDPSVTGDASDDSSEGSDSEGSDTSSANDPVWDSAYCQPVADNRPVNPWPGDWGSREQELLDLVNALRAQGTTCGGTPMPAVNPLTMNPSLHCAARVHSIDMATRDYFSHDNPEGESPFDRMQKAGYSFMAAGENIAAGMTTAADAMDTWEQSPGHCQNMMSPDYTEFGGGFAEGEGQFGSYWTQTFGRPL